MPLFLLDLAAVLGELGLGFRGLEDFLLELVEAEIFLFLEVGDRVAGGVGGIPRRCRFVR